ncbi:hypothetical protein CHCC15291_2563 [Bacillus licheniformis]|nr:hypothetical protein CHCC15291_2563 [Bacillus licheniformis]
MVNFSGASSIDIFKQTVLEKEPAIQRRAAAFWNPEQNDRKILSIKRGIKVNQAIQSLIFKHTEHIHFLLGFGRA